MLQFFQQFWQGLNTLSPSRRIGVFVVAVLSMISVCALVFMVNQKDYRVLFSNLSTEDAGKIIAKLQDKKISYKISSSGDTVSVPSENVSELRLDLAASGLPQGGVVGYEIFDDKNFGVTDFVQQLNYQRALQGELARTINNLDEVQTSRIHIVMPKKSLFVEKSAEPSASVFVKLRMGRSLGSTQIDGIVHLVASSVEELRPENVMVIDSGGRVLSKAQAESQLSKRTNSQIEYQRNIEKELADRIQSMLAMVVGREKVLASVSATLDFRVNEKTEEIYDSEEPAVRSRHSKSEKSVAPGSQNGQSTVAPTGGGTDAHNTNHERMDEVVNYEINRIVNKTIMPVGEITKLSVAVLVDGMYARNADGKEAFQPRSKKEMAVLEDLVKKSVGFDPARGDQVVVSSVPFRKAEPDMALAPEDSWKNKVTLFAPVIKYITSLIGILLVLLFVLRPLVKSLLVRGKEQSVRISEVLSSQGDQLGMKTASLSLESPKGGTAQELEIVKHLAGADDKGFAELLRNWMK